MAIAFFATIAAQMGSAWLNCSRNKAHSEKLAELQRAYEKKAAIEGIENARAEFAELCSFQREMEKTTHQDRLELIKKNHENALYQLLGEKSLHKWPLLVPPYVIANTPLTLGTSPDQKIPLNCILTKSTNLKFNRHVFPMMEEQIAIFCSKYWNISANKSIRFFQEAWKDNASDIGSLHKEIFAHLKNVPTLLISPIIKNDTILFRFYWWGLSLDPSDAHINELNELNPELSIAITKDTKFDSEISNIIVKECVPKLEALISFFSDMYYWNFYKIVPSLPNLIEQKIISLPLSELDDLKNGYSYCIKDNFKSANPINSKLLIEAVKPICSIDYIASIICESGIEVIDNKYDLAYLGCLFSDISGILPANKSQYLSDVFTRSESRVLRSYICSSLEMLLNDFSSNRNITIHDTMVVEFNEGKRIVSIYCLSDSFTNCDKTHFIKYNYKTSCCFVPSYLCDKKVKKITIKGVNFNEFVKCLSSELLINKFQSELSIVSVKDLAYNYSDSIIECKISRLNETPDNFNELEKINFSNIYLFELSDESNSWKFYGYFDRIDEFMQSLYSETNEIIVK